MNLHEASFVKEVTNPKKQQPGRRTQARTTRNDPQINSELADQPRPLLLSAEGSQHVGGQQIKNGDRYSQTENTFFE